MRCLDTDAANHRKRKSELEILQARMEMSEKKKTEKLNRIESKKQQRRHERLRVEKELSPDFPSSHFKVRLHYTRRMWSGSSRPRRVRRSIRRCSNPTDDPPLTSSGTSS